MDAKKDLAIRKIKEYIRELKKHGIRIEKAYLFGSYARGNQHRDSDIDVLVISRDFSGLEFYDWKRIVPFRRSIDVRIEPTAYRPKDFTDSDPLSVEVMATGEEIET